MIDPTFPARRGASRLMTWFLVPAILAGLVLVQAWLFRDSTCETYDEFTYLRMGICIYRLNDFKSLASPMCPPMPILLEYAWPALRAGSLPETPGWVAEVPSLIRLARLSTSVLVGVPLVWLVHGWLARRRGWAAGAWGGGMVAMSPTFLAAASIATTDACFALFAVLALAAIHRYQVRPTRWTFLAAGMAMGLALGSKQSAAILFPVAMVELLLERPGRKPGSTGVDHALRILARVSGRMAAWVIIAFVVDWALYGFRFGPRFNAAGTYMTIPVIIPMVVESLPNGQAMMDAVRRCGPPLAIDTFLGQMGHAAQGHAAFLMGRRSSGGWWYYFPVALAIKSTPAELAMMAFVVGNACRPSNWRDPARRLWMVTIATMLGAGMASSINIGQRYMLLIYPLVALFVADRLGELAKGRRWPIAAGSVLLAWQMVSVAGISPHYLGYFNSSIGGPGRGYRYLVDSNLDWGQDLPSLRRELEARGYRKVALAYFGTADPASYGLRAAEWTSAEALDSDWLAISATNLQGAYGGTSELFDRFDPLPSIRVGYSLFLYDTSDPRVRAAWEGARTRRKVADPPITPPGLAR